MKLTLANFIKPLSDIRHGIKGADYHRLLNSLGLCKGKAGITGWEYRKIEKEALEQGLATRGDDYLLKPVR
jgi:hypothetical protein